MSRIAAIDPETATGITKDLLDATQAQLGRLPNLYRTLAQSPAALAGYLGFRGALINGVLDVQMRERIALLTAAINDCGYCVSAHTLRGAKAGLNTDQLCDTQRSRDANPRIEAALQFVDCVIQNRGIIADNDFLRVKQAGWSDQEIGEMIAHVALNVFSNYFNQIAQPDLDFPAASMAR